ncbi:MAG TPA: lytic transglycosylase domain-containing protein [Syntrophales bacterium]|nr:lytic transglycosylase domain-containing protein [Syntrophales bacterium]
MQKKVYITFSAAIVIIFLIAFVCDIRLKAITSYSEANAADVERAVTKSLLWASDGEIRKLANNLERKYGRDIIEISKRYYICPGDIKAIAIVESLIDEASESGKGAVGLMGVKPATGREMGFDDVEHPINNLKAGTKYYKSLLEKFKDRELALAAYNLGPHEVKNRLNKGFKPETIDYIWKIRRVREFVI